MAATRRLQKELGDLRKAAGKSFRDIQVKRSFQTNPGKKSFKANPFKTIGKNPPRQIL